MVATFACRWDFEHTTVLTRDGSGANDGAANATDAADVPDSGNGGDPSPDADNGPPEIITGMCTAGGPCACEAGQACSFVCPDGGCDLFCQAGSTCQLGCGDTCTVSCESGANCALLCSSVIVPCTASASCEIPTGCVLACGGTVCGGPGCCSGT